MMTKFDNWCYDHADEMLMAIAGGANLAQLKIEFHIRAAGDGYDSKLHQRTITDMLVVAGAYYVWMQSNHPDKSAKEMIGTIHDLRLKMMGKKKCPK